MNTLKYKNLECLIIFVIIPISFVFNYSPWVKLAVGVLGFVYVIYVITAVEKLPFKIAKPIHWMPFVKSVCIKFIIIAAITTAFVWDANKDLLFNVLLNKPKLWVFIVFVYSVFSVYPQELLYRTFYFKRYPNLVENKVLYVVLNAFLFALAHLFFKNMLVLVLTFLGGIVFALTYQNTKSTLLVTIEHAIYGCWLFTVGMGDMLGFPS
ncbi:CPBP family intramembrane glutamic endopeptidase [Algibacter mikhailovii]|uniref:CPBP family intramembrane glutamic endopeptidase n=1 Tax=Algibacter mikhailovii TaxID=425498 RepID=UPI0024945BCE|nr:CPBP family intramembrane metalloprotease [Algibacter mikhailovii]